ncbi:ATP-binding protein [Aquimarina aggregata]|uniref:ATP-binding protein n=1 Tax=Aquimarina aggregata TaxID=1642818 RepID=UPI00248F89D3|nr:ATP-binding protein [Aquimarina aggregata]
MTKKIIYVLFIFCNVCFSQVNPTNEDRKLINQHIDYVNHNIRYLSSIIYELDSYNHRITSYVNNKINGYMEEEDAIVKMKEHLLDYSFKSNKSSNVNIWKKLSLEKLEQEFIQLAEFRKKKPSEVSRILKEVINKYQNKFNELIEIEDQLVKLSNDETLLFKSLTFESIYDLLTKYDLKYKELILINNQFQQTTQKLFGKEELPIALQINKDIAFSAQEMIHSMHNKDKKQFQKCIDVYEKSIENDELLTDERYKESGLFLNTSSPEFSLSPVKDSGKFVKYIASEYFRGSDKRRSADYGYRLCYDSKLRFEVWIVDIFNRRLVNDYNNTLSSATIPVLQIIKELEPFKVCFPTATPTETNIVKVKNPIVTNIKKRETITNNLMVLIDLSTSKKENGKLDKLKNTVMGLIETLQPEDQLTIITYTTKRANKIIKTGTDYDKKALRKIISELKFSVNKTKKADTNSGLMLAYRESLDSFIEKGSNRIVILSDGEFEASTEFKNEIRKQADKGVYLSTLHYTTKKQIEKNTLSDLAKIGKGTYNPIINEDDVLETLKNEVLSLKQTQLRKENEILSLRKEQLVKENEILSLRDTQLIKENEITRERAVKKTILIAFIIILIPIIVLLYVYFQKLRAQHKLRDKQEEINQQKVTSLIKNQELKLIKASIAGEHKERERIAQELHDSIGGNLSSIKLQLANFNEGTFNYDKIVNQIDETYELARDMSHNLIPKKFAQNPFTNLIEEYVENLNSTRNHHIICDLYPVEELNMINENLQVEVFKIIQELLTNTIKHANADKITIQLNLFEDTIKLLFEDDGVGFVVSKNRLGIGLTNIKNRLKKLTGVMHIDSTPKRGTIVNIDIPIVTPTLNDTHDEI